MGSRSSRIGSDRSSQPSRIKRTKRLLSSILLCGRTSNSNSHPSVLELESPINSIENLPPASVESITSAGVSSSFFDSEPVCTSSKSSESEPEESETHRTEEPVLESHGSDPVSAFDPLSEGSLSPDVFSSGVSETNGRESRRNVGGLFGPIGPISSRRRYRREGDFPSLTAGLVDEFGSRDRWFHDIDDHHHHHHAHEHGYGYSRIHGRNEERRRFRAQMSERGLSGVDEQVSFCASGLHREGTCSCGASFLGEETGSLGSISRVILLAQALSEVLDEIHRPPLSLSMPMLSLPAPESVVDSFLLKSHKKINASESGPNYVQQCYICLVDYEEGDKIRVLPCQHEYHAPCVDKWLKEVNGVCPVCRCNVCETQASVSTSELPA